MATGHFLTNRGKLLLLQGKWDSAAASAIKAGYIQTSQPAAYDTAAEVADLNFVSELLNTASGAGNTGTAVEATFTNYTRFSLVRTNAAEDDTNDRVNLDAGDWVIGTAGGLTNNTLYGVFFYDATTDTSDSTRQLISIDWFASPITTNGGSLTYAITDLYRAS